VNLLGGSHLRHKSQHRRNHGDDMQQPTHLAGFVQPYRVAKREFVRPEHPDAFVHRPETNAVNLSTERSTCGPPVVHFRRKIVIARVRRLAFAIGSERLIKRGPRSSKIVEDLERDSRSGMGTAHVDHQKDVIGLAFSQRLGRQAGQKK
jgi:hypothetical protein